MSPSVAHSVEFAKDGFNLERIFPIAAPFVTAANRLCPLNSTNRDPCFYPALLGYLALHFWQAATWLRPGL